MDSRTFLAPGDQVGRYEVLTEIARGGMAIVYAVRLRSEHGFDKKLAMKALLPHLLDDAEMVRMFVDEARLAAQIQHPHVVQVFDFGLHEGLPYLVMEFLRGQSLAELLRRGPLAEGAALFAIGKAAEGLHAAHEARGEDGERLAVVHRDVSPENIHVGYAGQVKVVDFGIARSKGQLRETRADQIKGKLAYLAPEQIDRRAEITRRADVWALGVVTWQALMGEPLFRGDGDADTMWNVLNRDVPRLDGLAPEPVVDLVERCLERDARERPADCDEVGRVLLGAAQELGWTRAAQLAEVMTERFEDERTEDRARLERVEALARELTASRVVAGRSVALPLAVASIVLLGAVGAAGWYASRPEPAPTPSPRASPAPAAAPTPPEPPAPEPEVLAPDAGPPAVAAPEPRRRARRRRRRQPDSTRGGDILRSDDVFSTP